MEFNLLFLPPIFFLIALLYSIAGFGGGSSYLAVLALSGINIHLISFLALICNIVVVTNGSFLFYKNKYLQLQEALPFVILSIPMAFMGGQWKITENNFFILLGITLLIASILLGFSQSKFNNFLSKNLSIKPKIKNQDYHWSIKMLLGGVIGFISGLVGIGGGIFLSPILHLINWNETKKIAALASFFILVNSVAGLIGKLLQKSLEINLSLTIILILAVFLGGQIGSNLAINQFKPVIIKRVTAILILLVSLKLLNDHLFN